MKKKISLISSIKWHSVTAKVNPNRCSNNLPAQHSALLLKRNNMTPIFQGHKKVTLDFFFTFSPLKWLVPCPNPLITQTAEGIRSSNFSEGNGWSVHIRTTSASLPSNKDKLISKIWAKCIHSGVSLWDNSNTNPKNGFKTFGYLFDWHNAVTSKVFSFSKNEISSILASWKM